MAITKPPVLPAWADAGDKVQPSNAELSVGWPVSSTPPSRQRFNWVLNYVANAVRYFSRRGLVDYDAAETYMTGDRVIGDDGKTYRSLIDNNTAQTPSTQPTKWERWGFSLADLGANAQTQPYTAFTTTGATGAFVLTPSPAITAYAANQRFRVKFHVAGNGADNLNVSGLGNKSLKQYDNTGAKVAAVIAANQLVDVEYDGVDLVLLDPLPPAVQTTAPIQGAFKNLQASATGANATVSISADEIAVEDSSNTYKTLRTVSLAINSAASGANGLDTGSLAASTWYSVWAIYNPTTTTTAGLLSLSATAPTMPSGYTMKARVGWVRTDGTGNKYPLPFKQYGRRVQYVVASGSNLTALPTIISGTQGNVSTPTWVAGALGSFVPSTAAAVKLLWNGDNNTGQCIIAPNNSYTNGSGNRPWYSNNGAQDTYGGVYASALPDMTLESMNIYYAANGPTNKVQCIGWEDNL